MTYRAERRRMWKHLNRLQQYRRNGFTGGLRRVVDEQGNRLLVTAEFLVEPRVKGKTYR